MASISFITFPTFKNNFLKTPEKKNNEWGTRVT